jgi:hypothetical protein
MKKLLPAVFLSFFFLPAMAQKVSSRLKFEQGQQLHISLNIKTTIAQQAMGQAIDFNIEANAGHNYKVTNSTDDNTTLHHKVNHISFSFDGMGQKLHVDSDKEKDMNGQFGKSIKELLDKKYDIIIDTSGKVLMALPEKLDIKQSDNRMAIINSMLKDVMDLVQPPKKGNPSFFQLMPPEGISKGEAWTTSSFENGGKADGTYTLADINDSTLVVDFVINSVTITKADMMGNETTTTLNNKSTGKIILDRNTNIIREKTSTTESNGNTEGPFGNMPVTSKTTATLKVNKED